MRRGTAILLLALFHGLVFGREPVGTLVIFHAGSLAVPMAELGREFNRLHPGLEIRREADGSRVCARKISELGRACDVMASADYRVIDELLIPGHASWNLRFASNELVVAMGKGRVQSRRVTADNVFDRMLSGELVFGRSDPDSDPCGYRTVHAIRLAGLEAGRPGMADSLLALHHRHMRPKEVDLLALLEMGEIDCLFIYRSVAVQHGLDMVALPAAINLGDPALDESYRRVWADVAGKRPGETTRLHGESMVYGVTIPTSSPNPTAALAFVRFLLEKEQGGAILARLGQPGVAPAPTDCWEALPAVLRPYARPALNREATP
ncbi:MAG: extracellular solute-binding protein [bacterium]|jgi:molybdate/tungstate transport system substrate-binding protein|nr:extracellular solute-binding protein [bacterium]